MQMIKTLLACAALIAHPPLSADVAAPQYLSPGEIVSVAKTEEWVPIAPSDLMVMDLAPDPNGKVRRVVIQLMPAPFSQGWVGNIRKLAAAKFWDGTSVNRVQDNYVVQWGDATEKKALPDGLAVVPESGYITAQECGDVVLSYNACLVQPAFRHMAQSADAYKADTGFAQGWPVSRSGKRRELSPAERKSRWWRQGDLRMLWPTHCYGMVGVGRNLAPDTGTGAELYTVIGHAPRHLDRNIALVGRVIEGIEHLSSLPRGTGALGFYEKEEERVPILSVRMGDAATDVPAFEYLSTDSASFAAYADARANRRDPFFNVPAGGADICNIPVPVRRKAVK
jgi:cyclophilin family peptidyl-prolyl cis-trans isomerase